MTPERISKSGQKTLQVLKLLKDHIASGMSNSQIAKAMKESPANINRYLNTLISEGYARKGDNGLYFIGAETFSLAKAYTDEINKITSMTTNIGMRV